MGLQKKLGQFNRNKRKEQRDAVKATQLYKDVDKMMTEIDTFYSKHIVVGELAKEIKDIHDKFEDQDTKIKADGDRIMEEEVEKTRKRIFDRVEQILLLNKIQSIKKEYAILSKHPKWQK